MNLSRRDKVQQHINHEPGLANVNQDIAVQKFAVANGRMRRVRIRQAQTHRGHVPEQFERMMRGNEPLCGRLALSLTMVTKVLVWVLLANHDEIAR